MGPRASRQARVVLDDCYVPADQRVGEEGQGFEVLAHFFNPNRVVVAGHALGPAAAAIEAARSLAYRAAGKVEAGDNEVQRNLVYRKLGDA